MPPPIFFDAEGLPRGMPEVFEAMEALAAGMP